MDQALMLWWRDVRVDHRGLRLSGQGHQACQLAGYSSWSYEAPNVWWPGTLLRLNEKLPCAYYVDASRRSNPRLILYGSDVAMMCSLYGDWNQFLDYLGKL
jgi:hypothetical protein